MLNQTILVGRLVKDVKVQEKENGKKYANITIAIPRNFKNENGEYDKDFIKCTLFDNTAINTSEYCHVGDIIGVKGRLQSNVIEKENDSKDYTIEVIAERITFLSSKAKDE